MYDECFKKELFQNVFFVWYDGMSFSLSCFIVMLWYDNIILPFSGIPLSSRIPVCLWSERMENVAESHLGVSLA